MRCISSFAGVIETKNCKACTSGPRKSWDGLPILLPEQRFPFLSSFCQQCAERSFFFSLFSLISRDASLPNSRSDRPGWYRETRWAKAWGRRWLHRCVEAGRSAATLDELLIWTNREAVGREYGQQQTQRWRLPEVFCHELLTADSFYFSDRDGFCMPVTEQKGLYFSPVGKRR